MAASPSSSFVPVPLPQLEVEGYFPTTFDYDPPAPSTMPGKDQWIEVFRKSTHEFKRRAAADPRVENAEKLAEQFAADFNAGLDLVQAEDHAELFEGPPTVLKLCKLRDEALRQLGFHDCFLDVKTSENERALTVLPGVLKELDDLRGDPDELLMALVQGTFAGNIFDLGAATSAALYENGGGDFIATRAKLKSRPWCVDDFDTLRSRWLVSTTTTDGNGYGYGKETPGTSEGGGGGGDAATAATAAAATCHAMTRYKKCVMFVDNSGADVLLGMLPLARELARRGCEVILAANEIPSINDITAAELAPLLPRVAAFDPTVAEAVDNGRLRVCSSGSDLPVIDLTRISPRLAAEVEGADLVVLEGMGRAIETNLRAAFTCDSLKLGMVKHPEVATCLGGELYDCVCKFDVGSTTARTT